MDLFLSLVNLFQLFSWFLDLFSSNIYLVLVMISVFLSLFFLYLFLFLFILIFYTIEGYGDLTCTFLLLLLLLLTDEHITIRNKQGAIDLRTTGFLK